MKNLKKTEFQIINRTLFQNKSFSKLFFFIFIFFNTNISAQTTSLWIGDNLTEIYFQNGQWFYQSEYYLNEIQKDKNGYCYNCKKKYRKKADFLSLDTHLDTIQLNTRTCIQLFIKPNIIKSNNFPFLQFEYEVLDIRKEYVKKFTINKSGIFRVSNEENKTLKKIQLNKSQMEEFKNLWQGIDIEYLNSAKKKYLSLCDNAEYSYTFIDEYRNQYNFTSVESPKQLERISNFIYNLEKL